jgi:hypothetical protein
MRLNLFVAFVEVQTPIKLKGRKELMKLAKGVNK